MPTATHSGTQHPAQPRNLSNLQIAALTKGFQLPRAHLESVDLRSVSSNRKCRWRNTDPHYTGMPRSQQHQGPGEHFWHSYEGLRTGRRSELLDMC